MLRALLLSLLLGSLVCAPARADDYFDKNTSSDQVMYRIDQPRSREAWIAIGALSAATLVFAGTGAAFHVSGNSKADAVERKDNEGELWTRQRQDDYDAAVFRRKTAFAAYAVASGFLVATVVTFIVSDPGTKLIKVGDESDSQATLDWVEGGAVVGSRWSF